MKKILALVLTLTMVFALSVPAFAAEPQARLTSPSRPSALSSWLRQAQAGEVPSSLWDPPGCWPTATKKKPLSGSSRRT